MAKVSRFGKMQYTIYIEAHLVSDVKWKARRLGVNHSQIINQAVKEYLERHPRDQEDAERRLYEEA